MIHLMLAKAQDADTNATPQYIQPHLSGPQVRLSPRHRHPRMTATSLVARHVIQRVTATSRIACHSSNA